MTLCRISRLEPGRVRLRVAFRRTAALVAVLSCSSPADAQSGPLAGPEPAGPSAPAELVAQLLSFRSDSSGSRRYRIALRALDNLGVSVSQAPISWVTASPLDTVEGPAQTGPDGRVELIWRVRSANTDVR